MLLVKKLYKKYLSCKRSEIDNIGIVLQAFYCASTLFLYVSKNMCSTGIIVRDNAEKFVLFILSINKGCIFLYNFW